MRIKIRAPLTTTYRFRGRIVIDDSVSDGRFLIAFYSLDRANFSMFVPQILPEICLRCGGDVCKLHVARGSGSVVGK